MQKKIKRRKFILFAIFTTISSLNLRGLSTHMVISGLQKLGTAGKACLQTEPSILKAIDQGCSDNFFMKSPSLAFSLPMLSTALFFCQHIGVAGYTCFGVYQEYQNKLKLLAENNRTGQSYGRYFLQKKYEQAKGVMHNVCIASPKASYQTLGITGLHFLALCKADNALYSGMKNAFLTPENNDYTRRCCIAANLYGLSAIALSALTAGTMYQAYQKKEAIFAQTTVDGQIVSNDRYDRWESIAREFLDKKDIPPFAESPENVDPHYIAMAQAEIVGSAAINANNCGMEMPLATEVQFQHAQRAPGHFSGINLLW